MSGLGEAGPAPGQFPKSPSPESSRSPSPVSRQLFQHQINPPPNITGTTRPRTPQQTLTLPPPVKMSKERSIPKLEPKLAGQHNYAEWISMMEMALTMHQISGGTIWDIVTGDISDPKGKATTSLATGTSTTTAGLDETDWKIANYFAVLTMKKNCEPAVSSKIGITKDAHQAYKNLKAHYEGKTVTDLGVLLASIVKLEYDDRSHTIEEHRGIRT